MIDASPTAPGSQSRLVEEFKSVLNDAEALLRIAAKDGEEGFNNARAQLEKSLKTARRSIQGREHSLIERVRHAGRAADEVIHHHPWKSIGVAAGIGLLLGALARR